LWLLVVAVVAVLHQLCLVDVAAVVAVLLLVQTLL
jgi:hypothetical protein